MEAHGNKRGGTDAQGGDADGRSGEVLHDESAAGNEEGEEDDGADPEDAQGEAEGVGSPPGVQEQGERAAEEEVVGAGEGGRVVEVGVGEAGVQEGEDGAEDEDEGRGGEGDDDELAHGAEAVHDEGPDKVELLFDIERPKVGDVEVRREQGDLPAPKSEIGSVGDFVILPAVPLEV